jgi:hypothetical protein
MRSIYFSPSCRDTRDNLLGSSSAGLISGVLGIAAAVTIITPAGPPLLIASLLFGGSATAVSTGTEARNYYSEPNKLAGRIQALHGMVHAILRVTGTLRDAMLRDHIRTDDYENKDGLATTDVASSVAARDIANAALARHKGKVMAAATAGRFSAAGMETAASVGTTSRFLSRIYSKRYASHGLREEPCRPPCWCLKPGA